MLYPIVFEPIFKDRIWGGRELERLYAKQLPNAQPIGESWEVSDRPGDAGVITNGPLTGKNLRWLMENHSAEVLGAAKPAAEGRFPLLCKILDAREKLSLQVHPPASKAAELKGEPKTEMWFIADATPDASLYVGLKRGVTRAQFEQKISDGTVADCFHRIPVKAGDTMFLPSGRVHAIGDGLVIFEIQQNSDTTYRVFDWNRVDSAGKRRQLHIEESLKCIDFDDLEPALQPQAETVVKHDLFQVSKIDLEKDTVPLGGKMEIIGMLSGKVEVGSPALTLSPGQFCLIPASCNVELRSSAAASFLRIGL